MKKTTKILSIIGASILALISIVLIAGASINKTTGSLIVGIILLVLSILAFVFVCTNARSIFKKEKKEQPIQKNIHTIESGNQPAVEKVTRIQVPIEPSPVAPAPEKQAPKSIAKKAILTICLTIVGGLAAFLLIGYFIWGTGNNKTVDVVFDAMQYAPDENGTISEAELIAKIGEPVSIEEWNYEYGYQTYPIRTLYYDNYEYSFNNDNLQRITIYNEFNFKSKKEFLPMFNLEKYENTEINDTNTAYRAYHCGVHDLWLFYEDGKITLTKISYSPLFGD